MLTHGAVSIVYDGDGNRVSEIVGGSTTKFFVDDRNPSHLPQVLDEIVNGSVTRTYAYGVQRISENQLISGTWTPSFYGYDGHGNVRFLTNSAGTITDTYTYDAFGMQIGRTGTTPNQFLYSGERLDSSVGLYDLRARYYNQAIGRFWAMDPAEHFLNQAEFSAKRCLAHPCGSCCSCSESTPTNQSQALLPAALTRVLSAVPSAPHRNRVAGHSYLYADDNPVNRTDPTGREAVVEYELTVERSETETVEVAKVVEEDICYELYLAETADCGAIYTDDLEYEACMERAWFNLFRCREGLPPI